MSSQLRSKIDMMASDMVASETSKNRSRQEYQAEDNKVESRPTREV
jgi:hypothetical protein